MASMEKKKHLLRQKYPDLQTSREAARAVARVEQETGEELPSEPGDRIEAYLERLERLALDPEKKQKTKDAGDVLHTDRPRAFALLRKKIISEYIVPNKAKMAEGAAMVEERAAHQMGIPMEYGEEQLARRGEIAVGDLESSLDQWMIYLSDPAESYPTWFRYYVFRNVLNLGEYDKDKQEFPKRSKGTVKLFPEVDRGALAYVQEMIEASQDDDLLKRIRKTHKELWNTPEAELLTKEKAQAFAGLPFAKQYAEGIKQNGEISPKLRAETAGEWVHYKQGEDPKELWLSLQNKGTAWCTKGFPTAETQLKGGDFHVYYTRDAVGNPTIPRIAIRMEGSRKIAENPRGVQDTQQNLEPNMLPILEEKLSEFGSEADRFKKRSSDMRTLTFIEQKIQRGEPITKAERSFLYEEHSQIEGFGYKKDPRIEEIRKVEFVQSVALLEGKLKESMPFTEDDWALILSYRYEQEYNFTPQDERNMNWRINKLRNGEYFRTLEPLRQKVKRSEPLTDEDWDFLFIENRESPGMRDDMGRRLRYDIRRAEHGRKISILEQKSEAGTELSKEELQWLYLIDVPDGRNFWRKHEDSIKKIREGRDLDQDICTIYECTKNEIAHKPREIDEYTKVYVGKLDPLIFQIPRQNLKKIYTSFPDHEIKREQIESGGKTGEQLLLEMQKTGIKISDDARTLLSESKEFELNARTGEAKLIRLSAVSLGFDDNDENVTLERINRRAQKFGLKFCSFDTGPEYAVQHRSKPWDEETAYFPRESETEHSDDPLTIFAVSGSALGTGSSGGWGRILRGRWGRFVFRQA